jgi:hypothetical protein
VGAFYLLLKCNMCEIGLQKTLEMQWRWGHSLPELTKKCGYVEHAGVRGTRRRWVDGRLPDPMRTAQELVSMVSQSQPRKCPAWAIKEHNCTSTTQGGWGAAPRGHERTGRSVQRHLARQRQYLFWKWTNIFKIRVWKWISTPFFTWRLATAKVWESNSL